MENKNIFYTRHQDHGSWVCGECGSLVGNTSVHDKFHAYLTRTLASHSNNMYPTLDNILYP